MMNRTINLYFRWPRADPCYQPRPQGPPRELTQRKCSAMEARITSDVCVCVCVCVCVIMYEVVMYMCNHCMYVCMYTCM